jgi:1-aminocyclopropane-1-carboxylate deaminase/D-cysteine desulfhydrase-like pyridoxal-dependent ACC family enzyme
VTRAEFHRWLDGITPTAPFTTGDAAELHAMIKTALPNAYVDVYTTRGDKVHILVDGEKVRDLDVV